MKGYIDKHGSLNIERGNKYKTQDCPFAQCNDIYCGDWCPLFEEPIYSNIHNQTVQIILCQAQLILENFTDERKDPNKQEIDIQADLVQEICKRYWDLQERIEIVDNIAHQIYKDDAHKPESEIFRFAKYTIEIMDATKGILKNLEGDVIEYDEYDEPDE